MKSHEAAAPESAPAVVGKKGAEPEETDAAETALDLDRPDLYLNREFTWIEFNRRVLAMATDPRTPLLERAKFLSIVGSNFDEFFMKRIGGLKQQVSAGVHDRTVDGRTPQEQLCECHVRLRALDEEQHVALSEIKSGLADHEIWLDSYEALSEEQQESLRAYYIANIYPLVTPQAMDPAHPFPFISNLSLNLLVTLHHPKDGMPVRARVKVPVGVGIPRFLRVDDGDHFVRLEDVMSHNLDLLFPGMEVEYCELFRITRNVSVDRNEDGADDLLSLIETELRERRFAPIVRLEIDEGMQDAHRRLLAEEFSLDPEDDVYEVGGMLALRDLMEIASAERPELHDSAHRPVDHPALAEDRSIFEIIKERGPLMLSHPYQSFTSSVQRFLKEASVDPLVRAIKMTVYRTTEDSHFIDHLIEAARNGKQVAVVVELKARFDEEANIRWANRLERVGVHVTYGVVGIKTHCKVILAVRQERDGLRRYVHCGTGNYHAQNARIYSDLGILTCHPEIGADVTELFNYLTTGYKPKRRYGRLLVAPSYLKQRLLELISGEITHQQRNGDGHIQFKMNALEDADVARALYEAAHAGVKVDLIVRDTCRVRPGLPGISESMQVISIVGRFLEHARIYYFKNGGDELYYIGSADLMKRNLTARIEQIMPVDHEALRTYLRTVLDLQLSDNRNAWVMQSDGSYVRREVDDEAEVQDAHARMIEIAEKAYKDATRLRKRKPRGVRMRNQT